MADELEQAREQERQEDVQAARDELAIHDAEPGAFKIFDGSEVVASCKSTYPEWYRMLTTAADGVTALRREQVQSRLGDLESGRLPIRRSERSYQAVAMAIQGAARRCRLGGQTDDIG